MPVRRRVSKWIWIAIGVLVVFGMVYASVTSDHPEWAVAKRWAVERRNDWRDEGCPVLFGSASAGCSREDYRDAARAAAGFSDELQQRISLAADTGRLSEADLTATASAVALLRKAAHRATDVAVGEARLGVGAEACMVEVHDLMTAFAALRLHARRLEADSPRDVLELLVDGLGASTDMATAGIGIERLVGQTSLQAVLGEIDDDLLRRSSGDDLARLATALEAIDEVLPVGDDFLERDIAHKILYFAEAAEVPDSYVHPAGFWIAWRHGFSVRSYGIAQICRQFEYLQRSQQLASPKDSTWPERQLALQWFQDQVSRMQHDYLGLPSIDVGDHSGRLSSATLALLRQAVAFHRRLPVPQLVDRLGAGPLRVEIEGDEAVFRSAEPGLERAAKRAPQ